MRHTPTWSSWGVPICFKEEQACLVEIEQTARQLETNADAIFPMAENAAYQCMDNGWWKHAQIDTFEAHCVRHVQFWDKVKDLDRYPENMLNVSQYCTSHKRLETAPLMGSINALLSCNCTKRSPLTFPTVTCRTFLMRTWEKYGNVPLH